MGLTILGNRWSSILLRCSDPALRSLESMRPEFPPAEWLDVVRHFSLIGKYDMTKFLGSRVVLDSNFFNRLLACLRKWAPILRTSLDGDPDFTSGDVANAMLEIQALASDCRVFSANLSGVASNAFKRHFFDSCTLLESLLQSRHLRNISKQGEAILSSIRVIAPPGLQAPWALSMVLLRRGGGGDGGPGSRERQGGPTEGPGPAVGGMAQASSPPPLPLHSPSPRSCPREDNRASCVTVRPGATSSPIFLPLPPQLNTLQEEDLVQLEKRPDQARPDRPARPWAATPSTPPPGGQVGGLII